MPRPRAKYDIDCQNFDYYFANESAKITAEAKSVLPGDVLYRMRPSGLGKLTFFDKLFILWKCLKKSWWLVIRDDENGIGILQFTELCDKRNKDNIKKADVLKSHGELVLANKELADTLTCMNNISMGPAYDYVSKVKGVRETRTEKFNNELAYIARFIAFWEGGKKKMATQNGLNLPEIYVLLYLYSVGSDVVGSIMYRETFKQAFGSTPSRIKLAFGSLQNRGYVVKTGFSKGATLRLTALGRDFTSSIIIRYAINC